MINHFRILRKPIFYLLLGMVASLVSCGGKDGVHRINPENTCWEAKEALSFEIDHGGGQFPLEIALLFTDDYPFSNLYLKLEVTGPEDWKYEDLKTETFIDPLGNWMVAQQGNNFPYTFSSFSNLELPSAGKYHFHLSHNMRKDPLCGIQAVTARINSGQ